MGQEGQRPRQRARGRLLFGVVLGLCLPLSLLHGDEVEDLARRGKEAYEAKNWAGAEAAYREAIRKAGPGDARLYLALGRTLRHKGDPSGALAACKEGERIAAAAEKPQLLECQKKAQADKDEADRVAAERSAKEQAAIKKERTAPPRVEETVPAAPAGMVAIRAGRFRMGSDDGEEDEKPVHSVTLKGFFLDQTEVTVAAYGACVKAGRCEGQNTTNYSDAALKVLGKDNAFWSGNCNYGKEGRDQHPINCVDWNQAVAYCRFAGKRLPTEAEWEYAARGKSGRKYPWGITPPGPRRLNACGDECLSWAKKNGLSWGKMYDGEDGWVTTAKVGSFPQGNTPEGLQDMAGNVWEWVQDDYASCYNKNKCIPDHTLRVLRGASWLSGVSRDACAANRTWYAASKRNVFVGFRCAQDWLR